MAFGVSGFYLIDFGDFIYGSNLCFFASCYFGVGL